MQRKLKLSRTHDYIIEATDGSPELIGKKCRLKLDSEGQEVELVAGFCLDLQAYMLSGPMKGNVIDLPPVKLKYSTADVNCRCPAYKFPHARGLGACESGKFVEEAPAGISVRSIFTEKAS